MKFALINGERTVATKTKQRAVCPYPTCCSEMISKVGEINMPHWAHKAGEGCSDTFYEPETEWHRSWKDRFPHAWQEVIVHGTGRWKGVVHRADVAIPGGPVIEFQHSSLNAEQIREREEFYTECWGSMIWVVDGSGFMDRWETLDIRGGGEACYQGNTVGQRQAKNILSCMYNLHHKRMGYWGTYIEREHTAWTHHPTFEEFGKLMEGLSHPNPEMLHPVFWPHARPRWSYALCPVFFDSGSRDGGDEVPFITLQKNSGFTKLESGKSEFSHHEVAYRKFHFRMDESQDPEEFVRQRPYLHSDKIARETIVSDKTSRAHKGYVHNTTIIEVRTPIYKDEPWKKKSVRFERGTREVFEWIGGVSTDKYGLDAKPVERESIHLPRYMLGRYRTFDSVVDELVTSQPLRLAA